LLANILGVIVKKKYIITIILILLTTIHSAFCGENGYKYVFIDGTFDLAHYGHQQVIQNALTTGSQFFDIPKDQIKVIVGISGTDEEITNYKRKPVYSIKQKMRQVNGFKGVHKVLNSPMITNKEFIENNKIDLVVAGGDYTDPIVARKYYQIPIDMGIFVTFPRTKGVSTTKIMKKVVDSVADTLLKRLDPKDPNYEEDQKCIQQFVILKNERF
jgi:cytidyltransferase-like protein